MKRIGLCFAGILISLLVLSSCTSSKDFYGLKLIDNSKAKDVSSIELMAFLEQDKTNEHEVVDYISESYLPLISESYLPVEVAKGTEYIAIFDINGQGKAVYTLQDYMTSGYMCANFAVDLHNNSEQAMIRCAVVTCAERGHAFNAFNATDKGLVYVDASTGIDSIAYLQESDLLVAKSKVRMGKGEWAVRYLGDPKTFKVEW